LKTAVNLRSSHGWPGLSMAFKHSSSRRAPAIIATLFSWPRARRCSSYARTGGLKRRAFMVARNRRWRTSARPPQLRRWPRSRPLSWGAGAHPTREALALPLLWPSSGSRAIRLEEMSGPMPWTDCRSAWVSRGSVVHALSSAIFSSMGFMRSSHPVLCSSSASCLTPFRKPGVGWRRVFSATSLSLR
jgi:hypothetical protein